MNNWRPIQTARKHRVIGIMPKVDLWLQIPASPRSMGMADSFRVPDCWRHIVSGKWVHDHRGEEKEICQEYITHWKPLTRPRNLRVQP
jgi:hypothetical protein